MNGQRVERIVAVIFLVTIGAFAAMIVGRFALGQDTERLLGEQTARAIYPDSETAYNIDIDWAALYPFEDGQTGAEEQPAPGLIERYTAFVQYVTNRLTSASTDQLAFRSAFIGLYARFNAAMGMGWIPDEEQDVYRLNNGHLTYVYEREDTQPLCGQIARFKRRLETEGINMLFILQPSKLDKYDQSVLPEGVSDYSNDNADRLLEGLSALGVEYVDIREELHAAFDDYYALFYRTDHHWKSETGLWVSGVFARALRDRLGSSIEVEVTDPRKYNIEVLEDFFLGSQGKKIGAGYVEPDDFSLITPAFDTLLHLEVPSAGVDLQGRFEDIMFDPWNLDVRDYYNRTPYSAYMYGSRPLTRIHNLRNDGGERVLLVRDSSSNVVAPFLALGVEYLDVVDLRQFTGSLMEFVRQTRPDHVIVAYGASTIDELDLESHTDLFDLR